MFFLLHRKPTDKTGWLSFSNLCKEIICTKCTKTTHKSSFFFQKVTQVNVVEYFLPTSDEDQIKTTNLWSNVTLPYQLLLACRVKSCWVSWLTYIFCAPEGSDEVTKSCKNTRDTLSKQTDVKLKKKC